MSEEDKERENGGSGTHTDNNLSRVQKVMKDNDIPFFYSDKDEENEDESDGAEDSD